MKSTFFGALLMSIYAFTFAQQVHTPLPENRTLSLIQQGIEQREYAIHFDAKANKYQSPNRSQNIRAFYKAGQWQMQARKDTTGQHNWSLSLSTQGIYADGVRIAVAENNPLVTICENEIEFAHSLFTEQYINNPQGVRQNFIINEAPANTKELAVKLAFTGMNATGISKDEIRFSNNQKDTLTYSGLKAWDAGGKVIEAHIQLNEDRQGFTLLAMTAGAVFPVTIDPIVVNGTPANANTTLKAGQASAAFGSGVSGAGDVNGDGYSDVIVGAPLYDNGQTDEGVAFIYHGSATGISTTAAITLEYNQAGALFGCSVSGAGDVNNDGYADVIVGARQYTNVQSYQGAIFVYHGSATGISATPATTVECSQKRAYLGYSVSGAGDVNGDGYSDVIAGAFQYRADSSGAAFVYQGSAGGISSTPTSTLTNSMVYTQMGYCVSDAGDVNADGYGDVVVGAPIYSNGQTFEGGVFVFLGSAGGVNPVAATTIESNQVNAYIGRSVSSAGDVNGDGYGDIIAGAINYSVTVAGEGAAFVYHGSGSGINAVAAATLRNGQATSYMGQSVSGAGDVNGDGYNDIIVSAYFYDNGQTDEGAVFVYQGSATGINSVATATIESNQAGANLGKSVSGAGDVNGDGYSDILLGASNYSITATAEGAAFVYHGSASSISNNTLTAAFTFSASGTASAAMGNSVSNAGDVNGDGYDDVIVGAYTNAPSTSGAVYLYYGSATGITSTGATSILGSSTSTVTIGNFGNSVSGAGDVNGDGYSDIIVGAYSQTPGKAYVYHGSASGLSTTPSRTLTPPSVPGGSTQFGGSVSGAGDVNGDGYADVIVGFPFYANGQTAEGAIYIYLGSASGISSTPSFTYESNNPVNATSGSSARLGSYVTGAGDLNGDGYSDVVASGPWYSNGQQSEGALYIWYGSTTGITGSPTIFESNVVNFFYGGGEPNNGFAVGKGVSSAGDVNGDGYSDLIMGTTRYLNNGGQGIIHVYHGSASGITSTPSFTVSTGVAAEYNFGNSVSSAGDVNGDGYSDIIVGDYYSGGPKNKAYLYHGSPAGIVATSSITLQNVTPTGTNGFGCTATTAGDVNGDGYSDIIVGALAGTGSFYIFQGNNGGGLRRNLRLYNTSSTTPIQQINVNDTKFGIGLFSKNPEGLTKGKLVWETEANGVGFTKSPITNSTQFTAQQAVFSNLTATGTQLTNNVDKVLLPAIETKVRVRIKYDAVTSQNGQVYSPWLYPQGIFSNHGMGSAPLPIELLEFRATAINNAEVKLDWVTATETNNNYFTIERSKDGLNWEEVTRVKGAGNSLVNKAYETFDEKPYTGTSYYRLKQTDFNGKFEYFKIEVVSIDENVTVKIYPNPAQTQINVEADAAELQELKVYNLLGQEVSSKITVTKQSDTKVMLDLSGLSKGVYYIKTKTTTNEMFVR